MRSCEHLWTSLTVALEISSIVTSALDVDVDVHHVWHSWHTHTRIFLIPLPHRRHALHRREARRAIDTCERRELGSAVVVDGRHLGVTVDVVVVLPQRGGCRGDGRDDGCTTARVEASGEVQYRCPGTEDVPLGAEDKEEEAAHGRHDQVRCGVLGHEDGCGGQPVDGGMSDYTSS
jgi:hypothetical protein